MARYTYKPVRKKIKIGTILDQDVVETIKQRAASEDKSISKVIEEAVKRSDDISSRDRALRLKALESLLAIRFMLTPADWNDIMEEDYYDQ